MGVILQSPLLKSLALAGLMAGVARWLVDFQFNRVASAHFVSHEALASFYGQMSAIVGLATVVFQLLVFARFVAWGGLAHAFAAQPLLLLCACFPVVAVPHLLTVAALRAFDRVSHFGIHTSVSNALMSPVPKPVRARATMFLAGVLRPSTAAASGVLLLGLRYLDERWMGVVIAALMLLWLGTVLNVRRQYLSALVDNLVSTNARLRLEAVQSLSGLRRDTALGALRSGLVKPSAQVRKLAVDMARELKCVALVPELRSALDSEDDAVRAAAVRALIELGGRDEAAAVRLHAEDKSEAVRRAVYESCALRPSDAGDALLRNALGSETRPRDRVIIAGALLQSADARARETARQSLARMVANADAVIRRLALEQIGDHGSKDHADLVACGLNDQESEVRGAAAGALGKLQDVTHLPQIVEMLADPALAEAARRAVGYYGAGAATLLLMRLADEKLPPAAAVALLEVLGEIGEQEAAEELLTRVGDAPRGLRLEMLRAANQIWQRAGSVAGQGTPHMRSLLSSELREIRRYRRTIDALHTHATSSAIVLLVDLYERQIRRSQEIVLELVRTTQQVPELEALRAALVSKAGVRRNIALETLEVALPTDLAASVTAAFEEEAVPGGVTAEGSFDLKNFFAERLGDGNAWMRACVAFCAGRMHMDALRGELQSLAESEDALVRESVREALERMAGEGRNVT